MYDIDSEDINHDGRRDLVITRTDQFGTGFYFQVLMQTSRRVFADESLPRLIHDRSTWIGNNTTAVDWMHLVDMNGDGAPDIVIDDPTVSSTHAELREEGGHWLVSDLGSTNGTYVNYSGADSDRRVDVNALKDGSTVRFGEVSLRLERQAPGDKG